MPSESESSPEDVLSDPLLIELMRETLYEMTLKRLNRLLERMDEDEEDVDDTEIDDDEEEDEDDEEDEEDDMEPADLEAFLAGGLRPDREFDLDALAAAMAALPDMEEELEDATEAKEERIARINDCLHAIIQCLGDLKHRYSLLWARARLAEKLDTRDEDPTEFFVNVDGHRHRITLPMEVDDEEKKELDELMAVVNQRKTNVARADDVIVRVRKRESPFDNFLLAHGFENMGIEVTGVKPFLRKRIADPPYLASIVTAVNTATAPWRTRTSRTPEEIEAERDRKRARIERKYPQYWGPKGAGTILCTFGALCRYAEVVHFDDAERLPGKATDPHACFADALPALAALSELVEEKIREGGDPRQDLEDVKPARQFFLCPVIGGYAKAPEQAQPLAEHAHRLITKEVELDRERRSAHTSSTAEYAARQLRLASVANRELVAENELGKAVILGNCELVRLEPSKKVTNEKRLLKLLNAAFETASRSRGGAAMTIF
jgi:hypothetical protein